MTYGWEGAKIRLVPLDKARHFDNAVRWINDPEVTWRTLMGDLPLTRLAEEDFFSRVCRADSDEIVFAVETRDEDEEHVGLCGLHKIEHRHGFGEIGLVIGRPSLWNHGLGTDTIRVLTRYAFEALGLRLLAANAFDDNVASLKALARCGYREIGRVPQRYWKRGAYRDLVMFALLREDWQPAPPSEGGVGGG